VLVSELVDEGVTEVYLLTMLASPFFEKLGFERIPREQVPPDIGRSREFELHACDDAVVMRRHLG
jgi:N-acetylglutamate synthase-like GNAT family acetyltransferase